MCAIGCLLHYVLRAAMYELAHCRFVPSTGTCIGIGMEDGRRLEPEEVVAKLPPVASRRRRYVVDSMSANHPVLPHNMTIDANTTAVVVGKHNITTNATLIRVKRLDPPYESNECTTSPDAGRVALSFFTFGIMEAAHAITERLCRDRVRDRMFRLDDMYVERSTMDTYTGDARPITDYKHANAGETLEGSRLMRPKFQVTIPDKVALRDLIHLTLHQYHGIGCHTSNEYYKVVGEKFKVLAPTTARIMFAPRIHTVEGELTYHSYKARLMDVWTGRYAFTCSQSNNKDEIRGLYWLEHRGEMTSDIPRWYLVHEARLDSVHMTKLSDRVQSSAACANMVGRDGYKVAIYNRRTMQCSYSTAICYSGYTYDASNHLVSVFMLPNYVSDRDANLCTTRYKKGTDPYKCLAFPRDDDSVVMFERAYRL